MSTHSSPDDSSREEGKQMDRQRERDSSDTFVFSLEFDWDSYLEETNSEAAPAANFRQVKHQWR